MCLAQTGESLQDLLQRKMSGCAVLQEYVPRPLLMDGYKWDARVYVLVTSIDPLRSYVARDGLARFCTELYRRPNMSNLDATYSHLTNYTLNKTSPGFNTAVDDPSGGQGSKRALSAVLQRIEKLSRTFTVQEFWAQMDHIVAMTLLSLQPELIQRHAESLTKAERASEAERKQTDTQTQRDRASFHLLGFDVLIDSNERPSLLEVNASPSLSTEMGGYNASTGRLEVHTCAVDHAIKSAIVEGVQQVLTHEEKCPDDAGPQPNIFSRLRYQNPEYTRISQLLRRIMRLQQRCLQTPASVCGERAGDLGPSRLLHFVRAAGVLSLRPEPCTRTGRGAAGIRRALPPSTVEKICRAVLSWSRGLQRNQPEHTRFGHMLIELARQQEAIPRDGSAASSSTATLLDSFTRKLEMQLATGTDFVETVVATVPTVATGEATGVKTATGSDDRRSLNLNRPKTQGSWKHAAPFTLGPLRGSRPLIVPTKERVCSLGIKLRQTYEQGTGPPRNFCSNDDKPRRSRPNR